MRDQGRTAIAGGRRRRVSAVAVMLGVATVVAACSSSGSGSGGASSTPASSPAPAVTTSAPAPGTSVSSATGGNSPTAGTSPAGGTSPTSEATPSQPGGTTTSAATGAGSSSAPPSHRGGSLRAAILAAPQETLDATKAADELDQARNELVYDKVAARAADGSVVPVLYTNATHNADGSQWVFTMNPKAVFADGTPVRGEDILATLAADAGQDSVQDLNMIDLKKSTASGGTVTFVLTEPLADLPLQFALSFMVVLPGGKGSTDADSMNGSGPYRVTSFTPGQRTVLQRREDYWGGDAHGMADTITLIGVSDPAAGMRALLAHQVDLAAGVTLADAKANESNSAVVLHESTAPEGLDFILNATIAPFDDVRVRQAFRLAIDRPQLAATALSGIGTVGNDVWGAGYPGYDADLPQRTQDIAQAKSLLAQAGHPQVSLTVYAPQGGGPLTQGTLLIAQQVKAAGFDVTVKQLSTPEYYSPQGWTTWPAVAFGLGASFATMAGFFYLPGSYYNFGWNKPEWTADFGKALATFDPAEQQTLLNGLQQQLWDSGPDVIWGLAPTVIATSPQVTGMDGVADFDYPDLSDVTVP